MKLFRLLLPAASLCLLATVASRADDPVAHPLLGLDQEARPVGFYAGIDTQVTHFGSLRLDGHRVGNPADQHLTSVVTQNIVGYDFTDRCALQLDVPYIYRDYQRTIGGVADRGHTAGWGDATVLTKYTIVKLDADKDHDRAFRWDAFAGVKLPTGESSTLAAARSETAPRGPAPNGVASHDLALGSGSYDYLIGTSEYLRVGTSFVTESVQYTIRTTGSHQFRYGNELSVTGGPGVYVYETAHSRLGLQALVTAEFQDHDKVNGVTDRDSAMTALYVGPKVLFTCYALTAELGLELPVLTHNSGLQLVPSYRLRGSLAWHF